MAPRPVSPHSPVWKCWSNISFRLDSAILLSARRRLGIPGVAEKQRRWQRKRTKRARQRRTWMETETAVARRRRRRRRRQGDGTKLQTKQFAYTSQVKLFHDRMLCLMELETDFVERSRYSVNLNVSITARLFGNAFPRGLGGTPDVAITKSDQWNLFYSPHVCVLKSVE